MTFLFVLRRERRYLFDSSDFNAQEKARHARAKARLGSLYMMYEAKYWYFEIFELLRKVFMSALPFMFSEGKFSHAMVTVYIFAAS